MGREGRDRESACCKRSRAGRELGVLKRRWEQGGGLWVGLAQGGFEEGPRSLMEAGLSLLTECL